MAEAAALVAAGRSPAAAFVAVAASPCRPSLPALAFSVAPGSLDPAIPDNRMAFPALGIMEITLAW